MIGKAVPNHSARESIRRSGCALDLAGSRAHSGPNARRRLLVVLCSLVAAGCLAGVASADYGWYGWLPRGYNANCVWYYGQANCTYFATSWVMNTCQEPSTDTYDTHCGFEDYNSIRGVYDSPNTSVGFTVAQGYGAGASVEGEVTCVYGPPALGYIANCPSPDTVYVQYSVTV